MSSMVLAIVGAAALAVCVVCLVVLHLVPSQVRPRSDPVSLFGTTRHHLLYRAQVIGSGVCALCLVLALKDQSLNLSKVGLATLGVYGTTRVLIAGFMMDKPGEHTQAGRIHWLLAALAFVSVAVAVGTLTAPLAAAAIWSSLNFFLQVAQGVTIVSVILVGVAVATPPLQRFMGVVERGIYLGALGWLALVLLPLISW